MGMDEHRIWRLGLALASPGSTPLGCASERTTKRVNASVGRGRLYWAGPLRPGVARPVAD